MKIGTCHQMRLDQLCKGCWNAARSEYGPVRPWNHHHRCESMYRNFNAHWTCWTWPIFNCKLHLRCVQMWWHKKLPQLDEVSLVLFSNALPSRKACKNRFALAPVQCPHHVLYVFSYRNQLCEQAKGNLCFRNALLTHVHRWQRSSYTLFVSGIGLLLFSSKSEMHSDVLCRSLSLLHLDLKMQLMCVFWFLHCYHGLVASKACITLWKVKSKTHSSSRNRSTLTIFA